METEVKKQIKKYSILFGLLVLGYVILYLRVSDFNRQERVIYISASDTEEEWTERDIRITMAPRGGSTDTWIKRIYEEDSNGELQEIQYAGIIYDIMVVNQAQAKVVDWKLQIEVPDDCFLNNAWCGELEIHQNVGGNEVYQALDLRKCTEKKVDIHLNHKIEGTDLMIPVSKGDYFVYLPSVRDEENVIEQRIQRSCDKLSGQFCTQIVNDQQVTLLQPLHLHGGGFIRMEPVLFHFGEQMGGGFIGNAVSLVRSLRSDAGREEGLAQTCAANEQEISACHREIRGILAADIEIVLHNDPGAGAVLGIDPVGVIIQVKIFKSLPVCRQQANLLSLLLAAKFFQAIAHLGAKIALAAAFAANRSLFQ